MNIENVHTQLLQLLRAFDGFCREQNIEYTLHGGSLLGAIREKGFIPWDDDLDVAMTRREFEKLCAAVQSSRDYYIAGNLKKQFRLRGNTDFWVDIFICDYISEKPVLQKCKLYTLTALDVMSRDKTTVLLSDFSKYGKGKQLAFRGLYLLGRLFPAGFKGWLFTKVSRDWWLGNRTMCVRSNDQYSGREKLLPAQWLEQYRTVPFADATARVSECYHLLLTSLYGESYMTPYRDDRNTQVHAMLRTEGDIHL